MPYFSHSYVESRSRILHLAQNIGSDVASYQNPHFAKESSLWLDVVHLGKRDAECTVIFFSGVHGVEGFCGSACQTYLLEHAHLFKSLECVLVHAVNPYGYALLSRTNEDNVDLNRHFVNFSQPTPMNLTYGKMADLLPITVWDEHSLHNIMLESTKIFPATSFSKIKEDIYKGQYHWPQGIFYGGAKTTWSRAIIEDIFKVIARKKKRIICVDIHSGLGDYGSASLIHCFSDDNSLFRAKHWFPEQLTSWQEKNAVSTYFDGKLLHGLARQFNTMPMTNFTLEFGTRSQQVMLQAILLDNCLRLRANTQESVTSAHCDQLQQIIKDAFAPDEKKWQDTVINNFSIFVKKLVLAAQSWE